MMTKTKKLTASQLIDGMDHGTLTTEQLASYDIRPIVDGKPELGWWIGNIGVRRELARRDNAAKEQIARESK